MDKKQEEKKRKIKGGKGKRGAICGRRREEKKRNMSSVRVTHQR